MKVDDCKDCYYFEQMTSKLFLCTKHRLVYLLEFSKETAEECEWNK